MSIEDLRKKINNIGYYEILFIIGGSNGLSKEVLQRANIKISFLSHDLSLSINANNPYRATRENDIKFLEI